MQVDRVLPKWESDGILALVATLFTLKSCLFHLVTMCFRFSSGVGELWNHPRLHVLFSFGITFSHAICFHWFAPNWYLFFPSRKAVPESSGTNSNPPRVSGIYTLTLSCSSIMFDLCARVAEVPECLYQTRLLKTMCSGFCAPCDYTQCDRRHLLCFPILVFLVRLSYHRKYCCHTTHNQNKQKTNKQTLQSKHEL